MCGKQTSEQGPLLPTMAATGAPLPTMAATGGPYSNKNYCDALGNVKMMLDSYVSRKDKGFASGASRNIEILIPKRLQRLKKRNKNAAG